MKQNSGKTTIKRHLWYAVLALGTGLGLVLAQAEDAPNGWARHADGSSKVTTGGAGGPVVTIVNADEFKKYVGLKTRCLVQVRGAINLNGEQVNVRSDKTIMGLGTNAALIGGLKISHYNNLILRNLTIRNSKGDGLTIQNARHIWVDHCTFIDAKDGQLDITHAADWITVSWCKFYYTTNQGHNFVNLIGHSDSNGKEDSGALHVTWHHNWWSALCVERMPRVRFGRVHLYNNYFNVPGNNYCIRAALHSEILSENKYFENADEPFEYYRKNETQPIGKIHDVGSKLVNCTNVRPAEDAVFTPPYPYRLDLASQVPAIVMAGAGAGKIIANADKD